MDNIQSIKSRLSSLEKEAASAQGRLHAAQERVIEIEASIRENGIEPAELESVINSLSKEIAALSSKIEKEAGELLNELNSI